MNTAGRTIIVAAAGSASRFAGLPKELLPIADGECSLSRAVGVARRCGTPLVVTSREKESLHRRLLPGVELCVQYQEVWKELWGAISLGVFLTGDNPGGLLLADTVLDFDAADVPEAPLTLGLFETPTPERFSVFAQGRIWTKRPGLIPSRAWGVLFWNAEVAGFLRASAAAFTHYDDALNAVLARYGAPGTFPIRAYHDLGSWAHYRHYISTASPP